MWMSRNGRWPSSSNSIVNFILSCIPLSWFKKSVSFSLLCGQITKVSSTYLYQQDGLYMACLMAFSSKSSMKKFAMTGESGEQTDGVAMGYVLFDILHDTEWGM